jgi:perosamine synthetase
MPPEQSITVSNGTTALYLALLAVEAGPADEVIVPAWCFAAAANMVLACGARPVFADVRDDTWLLDPDSVAECLSPRTKAIVAVHTYGVVCDMDALGEIARRAGVSLIEDCAESPFSRYRGQMAGTIGDLSCFSFQATKTITCGEGGMVLARDPSLAARMRLIRNHGMRPQRKYWHETVGHNFRLTNLQAALACAQLEKLGSIECLRRRVFEGYRSRLNAVPGIALQAIPHDVDPLMWAFALRLEDSSETERDTLIARLAARGIETRPAFYAFSDQPLYQAPERPHAQRIARCGLSLPAVPDLTNSELDEICEAVTEEIGVAAIA